MAAAVVGHRVRKTAEAGPAMEAAAEAAEAVAAAGRMAAGW